MLEARLGDGFPTERRTAEAWASLVLADFTSFPLPRKTASRNFHKVQDREPPRGSGALRRCSSPSSSSTQSCFQVIHPQARQSFKVLAMSQVPWRLHHSPC